MSDLSGTSSQWWALVLDAAAKTYAAWVTSTPLQRLRLKVVSPNELAKWPRTEQRAVTMLLAAVPDPIRRGLISSRKLQSVEILYALLCRFQPGGVHEKTSLLKASWRTDWVPMRTSTSSCRPCGCGDGIWEDQLSWEFNFRIHSSWLEFLDGGRTILDALEDLRRFTECRRFDKTCSWTSSQRMSRLLTLRRRYTGRS